MPELLGRRVLLKITGESLGGGTTPLDIEEKIPYIVSELVGTRLKFPTLQLAIVVGGGNFIRGKDLKPRFYDQSAPDRMGMLCTVLNAMTLRDQLEKTGIPTRVMSSVEIKQVCEPYIQLRAMRHLEKGRIVIFAGGTGNPNFTTDTAAVEKALDIGAEIVLKATKVRGVYTADPKKDPNAVLLPQVSFQEFLRRDLRVLDSAAAGLAREKGMRIRIFNIFESGNLLRVLSGQPIGSLIS